MRFIDRILTATATPNGPFDVIRLDTGLRIRWRHGPDLLAVLLTDDARAGDALPPILAPEIRSLVAPGLQQALAGTSTILDPPVLPRGGSSIHLRLVLMPEWEQAGNIIGVTVCIIDITKRTQNQLDMLALWHALDSHSIVAITDARGTIIEANNRFCILSKYSRDELIGSNHRILNSGFHPPGFFRGLWKTISQGDVWHGEIRNRAKDGSIYWVKTSIYPVPGAQGRPAWHIALRTDITANKRMEDDLQYQSMHDPLTALPNRRALEACLREALDGRHGVQHERMALLFIDLDGFKDINDVHGHLMGDSVLRWVAAQLSTVVDSHSRVFRLGGDEFVVVLGGLGPDPDKALAQSQRVGRKVIEQLSRSSDDSAATLQGIPGIHVGACVGISLIDDQECSLENIIRHPDIALNSAKAHGKGQIRTFDWQMEQSLLSRTMLENRLRQALHHREFLMHYQPIADGSGRIVGLEALLRWQCDDELRMPAQFLDVAELSGLIVPIGREVLEMTCAQVADLHRRLPSPPSMAINVSPAQFCLPQFVPQFIDTLERTGARAEWICLELTESMLLKDKDVAIANMHAIKQQGACFALDDFGTGYSSLSYLAEFPFDRIKIDKSFVQRMQEDAGSETIVKAILSISSAMKVDVIAEGVETIAQRDRLRELGCGLFQGYLFGRPREIEALYPR